MSHRISIHVGSNEFLIDQPDERIFNTATGRTATLTAAYMLHVAEIIYHRKNGFSPNCVICHDEAKSSLQAAPALRDFIAEYYSMSSHNPQTETIPALDAADAERILWEDADQRWCPEQIMRVYEAPGQDVEQMQARFAELEASLVGIEDAATFEQVCNEMTELQQAIERENGHMDDYAGGRSLMIAERRAANLKLSPADYYFAPVRDAKTLILTRKGQELIKRNGK